MVSALQASMNMARSSAYDFRFVTTKKSDPKGTSGSPYLIRSYDHDRQTAPNRDMIPPRRTTTASSPADTDVSTDPGATTKKEVSSKLNYGKAQEFEIWQVARAATAAPFFFEPLKVEKAQTSGHILFTDGGFGNSNNPTRQAMREIEDLHGRSSIGTVVSVGTARKKKEDNRFRVVRFLESMAFDLTDPETIHDDMQREHDMQPEQDTQKFSYFRLNHPEGLDIELDRWEPKGRFTKDAGSQTITTIRDAFAHWANQSATRKDLKSCAKMLVKCRWNRMNTPKWERYATGARYRCRFQGCDLEDFFDGDKFKDHLRGHGRPDHYLDKEVDHCRYYWKYQAASATNGH